MPSSKFSSWPPAHKRPPICHKGPPGSTPPLPEDPRRQLTAWVRFADKDPLAYGTQVGFFQITWNDATREYFGRSSKESERLELTLIPTADVALWNARLDVWDTFRLPESFLYFLLPVPTNVPFDTGKFGDVVISGLDFRILRVME